MSNDALQIADGITLTGVLSLSPAADFSLLFWLRFDQEPGQDYSILAQVYENGDEYAAHYLQLYSGDGGGANKRALWLDCGGGAVHQTNVIPAVGQWAHVCLSWDQSDLRLRVFINGTHTGGNDLPLGMNPDLNRFILGDIDGGYPASLSLRSVKWLDRSFQVADAALVAAEAAVETLANPGDATAWYDLDGAADTEDQVGALDLTVVGTPTTSSNDGPYRSAVSIGTGHGAGISAAIHGGTVNAAQSARGNSQAETTSDQQVVADARASGRGHGVCSTRKAITSAHGVTLPVLVEAFRTIPVAFAAGINRDLWASEVAPRVYDDVRGYIGGRHRGRLPFVEIEQASEAYDQRASDLGMHPRQWAVLIHVGGLSETEAEQRARNMLGAALSALRATGKAWLGNSQGGTFTKDPLGYVLAATIGTRNTYDPATHDTATE